MAVRGCSGVALVLLILARLFDASFPTGIKYKMDPSFVICMLRFTKTGFF